MNSFRQGYDKPAESISFRCPKCNNLCAFKKEYAGYGARCTNCQGRFVIPEGDGEKAKLLPSISESEKPEPGFYSNVLKGNLTAFAYKESLVGLVYVMAAVCFEFFIGHVDLSVTLPGFRLPMPIGLITVLLARGILFWYFGEVINWGAIEIECLPEVTIGAGFEFIWNVIKNTYLFIAALFLSIIPFGVIGSILESFMGKGVLLPVNVVLFGMALFVVPLVLITIFVGRRIDMIFRVDYVFRPLVKAFVPYLLVAGLTIAAGLLQLLVYVCSIGGYGTLKERGTVIVILFLMANLGVTALTIFAMRTIGLYCRHYRLYMPHIWAEDDRKRIVS